MKPKNNSFVEGDILIVDDTNSTLELLLDILISEGYNVSTAKNCEIALQNIKVKLPILILLDFKLTLDGCYDFCRTLKADELTSQIPIIFISALEDVNSKAEGYRAGAIDFITKPFHNDEVLASVKTHIELRQMQLNLEIQNIKLQEEIKERMLAEETIRLSEARLRRAELASKSGNWELHLDTNIIYASDGALKIYGVTNNQLDYDTIKSIPLIEYRNLLDLALKNLIEENKSYDVEFKIKSLDADTIKDIHSVAIYDVEKRIVFGIIQDITDRKRAEETNHLLAQTLKSAQDCISITDLNNKILFVNDAFLKTYEYNEDELIGKDINVVRASVSPSQEGEMILSATIEGYWHGEIPNKRKDGTEFPIELWASLVKDKDGSPIAAVGVARDITERKLVEKTLIKAKEKAEESDHLKTAFLHNISHEIRTPMNAIIGFSEILNDPDLDFEDRMHFTDIIVQSSNQLLSIINDIISIATIETGQVRTNLNEVNINDTLKLLYDQFTIKSQVKNIILNYDINLPNEDANIITDNIKLFEILTNLISNALKFTKEGHVTYGYHLKNNYIEFYVEDTGIGILPDMYAEIFKRFRQVDSTNSRQYGGSGLGLSISKAFVELLGGEMWVDSELNKGSIFYFTIPYNKATANIAPNVSANSGFKLYLNEIKTIVVAEDEDSNFMLLQEYLSGMNLNIIRACNGLEVVDICKTTNNIDLVLMDIKMPELNGYDATTRIRTFAVELPIIALTAYSLEVDIKKALASGCNDTISKPINKKILISKLKEYLEISNPKN